MVSSHSPNSVLITREDAPGSTINNNDNGMVKLSSSLYGAGYLSSTQNRGWSHSGPPSLSVTADNYPSYNNSEQQSGSDAQNCGIDNNNCTEERYEAYGSKTDFEDNESPDGTSSTPSPIEPSSIKSPNSAFNKHTWLRNSMRRASPGNVKRRLSSNALASQLYRSSSFNSSGRGSICDNTDDMYSDVSLEEDVIDLNQRVHMIQEQMNVLADTQSASEEKYARVKQENATLQARILMLEEAIKDAELKAEDKLQSEQKRHKEWVSRFEREKQLQLENYSIKLQAAESENANLKDETVRLKEQLERIKAEKSSLDNALYDARRQTELANEAERLAVNRFNEVHQRLDIMREQLGNQAEDRERLEQLEKELSRLRVYNKSLEETRDELQAAAALHAGRELLQWNLCSNNVEKGPTSLAVELLAGINHDEVDRHDVQLLGTESAQELRRALKDQQEVNAQLRSYIDNILLNIVDNYPQLLEVKQTN